MRAAFVFLFCCSVLVAQDVPAPGEVIEIEKASVEYKLVTIRKDANRSVYALAYDGELSDALCDRLVQMVMGQDLASRPKVRQRFLVEGKLTQNTSLQKYPSFLIFIIEYRFGEDKDDKVPPPPVAGGDKTA